MKGFKEGGSISRPPHFDGSTYAYWKAKMTAFLRSIDSKTWKALKAGWMAPTVMNDNVVTMKPEADWTGEEDQVAVENDKSPKQIKNLNAQLQSLNKGLKMMNSSTHVLEEILEIGKCNNRYRLVNRIN
ncbi:hypothetical protein LIER_24771 [Lithospermum erythrorhizon]|uniref:Gag-pol polyprotein n=1 Tax=Lithospermum erythrorhizon TaxID=34254 RepID=A0AAV3R6M3_LITER